MWEQYSKREQSSMWEYAGAVFHMDAWFHMGAMFSVGLVCCVGARSIWHQCSMCGSSLFYTSSVSWGIGVLCRSSVPSGRAVLSTEHYSSS